MPTSTDAAREGARAGGARKKPKAVAAAGARVAGSSGASRKTGVQAVEHGAKMSKSEKARLRRYARGEGNSSKGVRKPELKRAIKRGEAKIAAATKRAAQSEVLLPTEAGFLEAEGLEYTDRFTQRQIASAADTQTAAKAYNMTLDQLGPYRIAFAADGRRVLLGGRKGHVAVMQWEGGRILHEMHLGETVRDLTFLRDHTTFAVAQHKNLYIYDGKGVELHCLRTHRPQVNRLGYLRYHWLLATVGPSGVLRYLDVSTGENVAERASKLGECDCLRVNPWNALVHLGHANGMVSLWTPNLHEPVAKMLCHKGAVSALAIDRGGRHMVTAGRDGVVKVWDVRTYRSLHSYRTPRPASAVDISDRGLLAVAHGPAVQVFADGLARRASRAYVAHKLPGCAAEAVRARPPERAPRCAHAPPSLPQPHVSATRAQVRFCPYEDVLGVGHSRGYCSMLVPGAGEPNFDAYEARGCRRRRLAAAVVIDSRRPSTRITCSRRPRGRRTRTRRANSVAKRRSSPSLRSYQPRRSWQTRAGSTRSTSIRRRDSARRLPIAPRARRAAPPLRPPRQLPHPPRSLSSRRASGRAF